MKSLKLKSAYTAIQNEGELPRGYFDCECGARIHDVVYNDGIERLCTCGLVYSSTGWILNRSAKE